MKIVFAGTGALLAGLLTWSEWVHWRASWSRLGTAVPGDGTSEAVVVLGYRNRGIRANAVNRWRVRAGMRSLAGTHAQLVLSGGPVSSPQPEACLMAEYAREVCGYRGELVVETESRSTAENIGNVVAFIEHADRIKIVSHSVHAEKARAYLWRMRPDLAARLVRARDYRPGEWLFVKPALALLGVRNMRRLTRPSGR